LYILITLLNLSTTFVHQLLFCFLGIDIYQISFILLLTSINWWSLILINLSKSIGFNYKFFLAEVGVVFCRSTGLFVHVLGVVRELLRIPGGGILRVQRLQVD
jgi:hypothetical protein